MSTKRDTNWRPVKNVCIFVTIKYKVHPRTMLWDYIMARVPRFWRCLFPGLAAAILVWKDPRQKDMRHADLRQGVVWCANTGIERGKRPSSFHRLCCFFYRRNRSVIQSSPSLNQRIAGKKAGENFVAVGSEFPCTAKRRSVCARFYNRHCPPSFVVV